MPSNRDASNPEGLPIPAFDLIRAGAVLKVYQGSSQALTDTDRDRLDSGLLEFINP